MTMSSGSNQRTLFQTWGGSVSQGKVIQPKKDSKKATGRHKTSSSNSSQAAKTKPRNPLWPDIGEGSASTSENPVTTQELKPTFEDEEDDDLMVVAVYEAEKSLQLDQANCNNHAGTEGTSSSSVHSSGQTYPDFPGFDSSSAKVWIYPTNYPIREYQLKISEAALFQNTLVCLPTGLGKTFIASVVMYNFYRWYPSGKIVFMAPTKPLVAQQIEACYKVMGIPQAHMAELTGNSWHDTQKLWYSYLFLPLLKSLSPHIKAAQQRSKDKRCGGPSESSSSLHRSWWMICPEIPVLPSKSSVWSLMKPTRHWATMLTVRYTNVPFKPIIHNIKTNEKIKWMTLVCFTWTVGQNKNESK